MMIKDNNKYLLLSRRLSAAASFVRNGSVLADIGTDHAFLPIFCIKNGISTRAIAADVNALPLERAKENIEKHDLTNKIECVLTSGFDSLDKYGITDGAVCGMGGELIASIVAANDFIKNPGFRLIVQPMTMPHITRKALLSAGFDITEEITLTEENKYYTVICADYCGTTNEYSEFELLFGDFSKKHFEGDNVREKYIHHSIVKYQRIIDGKCTAGISAEAELKIVEELKERLIR